MTISQLLFLLVLTSLGSALGSFLGIYLALNSKQEIIKEAKDILEKIKNSTITQPTANIFSPLAKEKVKRLMIGMKDEL